MSEDDLKNTLDQAMNTIQDANKVLAGGTEGQPTITPESPASAPQDIDARDLEIKKLQEELAQARAKAESTIDAFTKKDMLDTMPKWQVESIKEMMNVMGIGFEEASDRLKSSGIKDFRASLTDEDTPDAVAAKLSKMMLTASIKRTESVEEEKRLRDTVLTESWGRDHKESIEQQLTEALKSQGLPERIMGLLTVPELKAFAKVKVGMQDIVKNTATLEAERAASKELNERLANLQSYHKH